MRTGNLWQDYINEKEIITQPTNLLYAFTQLPFLQMTKWYYSLWSLKLVKRKDRVLKLFKAKEKYLSAWLFAWWQLCEWGNWGREVRGLLQVRPQFILMPKTLRGFYNLKLSRSEADHLFWSSSRRLSKQNISPWDLSSAFSKQFRDTQRHG